mmetsp:Transcript_98765/g.247540  ORF Transcript_98765/g.247540 Transcript_98765/m.247540 type:complete len:250 (-) Transcript_98765:3308-4057(-)
MLGRPGQLSNGHELRRRHLRPPVPHVPAAVAREELRQCQGSAGLRSVRAPGCQHGPPLPPRPQPLCGLPSHRLDDLHGLGAPAAHLRGFFQAVDGLLRSRQRHDGFGGGDLRGCDEGGESGQRRLGAEHPPQLERDSPVHGRSYPLGVQAVVSVLRPPAADPRRDVRRSRQVEPHRPLQLGLRPAPRSLERSSRSRRDRIGDCVVLPALPGHHHGKPAWLRQVAVEALREISFLHRVLRLLQERVPQGV